MIAKSNFISLEYVFNVIQTIHLMRYKTMKKSQLLWLAMGMSLVLAAGCADKPLPVPPGTDSPTAGAEGGATGDKMAQDSVSGSGGLKEDSMASANTFSSGDGKGSGEGSHAGGTGDFLSGPVTGEGSKSGGLGDLGSGSGLSKGDSGANDFAGSGSAGGSGHNDFSGSGSGDASSQVARMLPFHTTEHLKDIFFSFDKSDLTDQSKDILRKNADWLKENPNARVEIQGHCDERGTNNYNLGLGERRAQSTKNYLVSQGVSQDRIFTISYGEEKPFCTERGENCWWQNRRGHFMVSQ